jgi:predicted ATPase/DNA-binding SARP family transcriptional activator
VAGDGRPVALGRGRQRALLGLLVLRANEVVSQERLVDELWGESPPPTALTALHGHVSRLRKLVGDDRLQTRLPGYLLRIEPDELDLNRFRDLADRGRYREALALWRGPPLSDLAFEPFARGEIDRLEELRLATLERAIDEDLAAGRHAELVGELEALIRANPFGERFVSQLMLALYRCGRQADALEVYRTARARLDDELGLEPSEPLRRLERRILDQDPSLEPEPPARRRGNLPAQASSFIGRMAEVEQIRELLARPDVRLVTLTGTGGTGKTRLALEAVRELPVMPADGVWFVPLAAIADPELVVFAIAQALGVQTSQGQPVLDALRAFLAERRVVLVVDNFEHLLDGASVVGELLAASPGLTVLATSRDHLNLYGEFVYSVPPLGLSEGIELFVERARAARRDFALDDDGADDVSSICTQLDGLPLAIELAAARVRSLELHELAGALSSRLEVLTDGPRDVPARQRTLRATIEWSHDLLTAAEQALFARLAVFAGGCTAEAAAAVCCADLSLDPAAALRALTQKGLLVRSDVDGEQRFAYLETIREFALERLAGSGAGEVTRDGLAQFLREHAEDGGPNIRGAERAAWLAWNARELENIRAALAWCADAGDAETGLLLFGALMSFWLGRGLFTEGLALAEALLRRSTEPTVGRARTTLASAMLSMLGFGDLERMATCGGEAVELARRLDQPWLLAVGLNVQGTVVRFGGDHAAAHRLYREALDVAGHGELWWPSTLGWGNLGVTAVIERRYVDAVEVLEPAAAFALDAGEGYWAATFLTLLCLSLARLGELERSGHAGHEALTLFGELGNWWGVATTLEALATLAHARGEELAAARLLGAEEEACRREGVVEWISVAWEREQTVRGVAEAVGQEAFERALAEGAELGPAEVVACAESVARLEFTAPA